MNYTEKQAKNLVISSARACSHFLLILAFCCLNLFCRLFAGARLRVFLPALLSPRPRLPLAPFLPAGAPFVVYLESPPRFWIAFPLLRIFKGYFVTGRLEIIPFFPPLIFVSTRGFVVSSGSAYSTFKTLSSI